MISRDFLLQSKEIQRLACDPVSVVLQLGDRGGLKVNERGNGGYGSTVNNRELSVQNHNRSRTASTIGSIVGGVCEALTLEVSVTIGLKK